MLRLFRLKNEVMIFPGIGNYHYVLIPKKESQKIKEVFGDLSMGFGSIKVMATVGSSKWKTSIFPQSKVGSYLLLLNKQVRKQEKIQARDKISFIIEILV